MNDLPDDPGAPDPLASEDVAETATTRPGANRRTIRAEQRRLLMRSPGFLFGLVVLGIWVLCALIPDLLAPFEANEVVRVDDRVIPRTPPSADAWFGTDKIGNDVFSRVVYGARNVLVTAPVAAALAAIAGTSLGLVMGYFRGFLDEALSRIIEALLSIPVILLALMVLFVFGTAQPVIIATVAVLFTPVVTRTVRTAVLAEVELDYVTSAKLRGEGALFVMFREILPNITGVIVVEFTVRVGYAIFTVATLAFIGFSGGDATTPDWGRDIANTYDIIRDDQWWPSLFPAMAIASLVIAVNLIADSLEKVTSQ